MKAELQDPGAALVQVMIFARADEQSRLAARKQRKSFPMVFMS